MAIWRIRLLLGIIVGMSGIASHCAASELKIFTNRAIWTILNEVGPDFERSSGYKLTVTNEFAQTLARRIEDGENVDIFVGAPAPLIDRLVKNGKVVADTRVPIARSGIGVQVRAGAPKPDISTMDAFKQALLKAKSIAYLQTGASGVYLSGVLDRLGISEAIKDKLTRPEEDIVSELVASGKVELGMVVITQILTSPGVELVGPIPKEIQFYVNWFSGVTTSSKSPDAARGLLKFLTSPAVEPVLKKQGMERG